MKHGIDISRWNGDINITSLNPDFVIIKAGGSDDGLYIDSRFLENYIKCKNAGIPCGLYWYTKAQSIMELDTEISYLLDEINGLQFELPLFLDLEESSLYHIASDLGARWLNTLPRHGYYPALYASYSWWMDSLKSVACDSIQKWVALWGGYDDCGIDCGVWQTGVVDNIDRNIMYADYGFIKENGMNGFKEKVYFSDVTADRKGYKAIQKMAQMGIVKGFPDGTFRPDENVTREQLCIMLDRLLEVL